MKFNQDSLQIAFMEIVEFITWLFNQCLLQKTFPTRWKKRIIFPIYKDGNKYKPEIYRPICLIDCIAKVVTGLLSQHLSKLMEENKLFNDFQFGFRKERE